MLTCMHVIRILCCIFQLRLLKAFYKVLVYSGVHLSIQLSLLSCVLLRCASRSPGIKWSMLYLNSCTKTDCIYTTAVFSRKNDTGIKSGRKWGMQTSGRSLPEGSALVIEVVPTTGASFGLRLQFLSGWDFLWQSVQRRQTESRVSFLRNVRATGSSWILHLFDKSMFHISHSEFLNNLSAL